MHQENRITVKIGIKHVFFSDSRRNGFTNTKFIFFIATRIK